MHEIGLGDMDISYLAASALYMHVNFPTVDNRVEIINSLNFAMM